MSYFTGHSEEVLISLFPGYSQRVLMSIFPGYSQRVLMSIFPGHCDGGPHVHRTTQLQPGPGIGQNSTDIYTGYCILQVIYRLFTGYLHWLYFR